MDTAYYEFVSKLEILEDYISRLRHFTAIVEGALEVYYEDDLEKRYIWEDEDIFAPHWEDIMYKQQVHDLHYLYMELARVEATISALKDIMPKPQQGNNNRTIRQYDKNMRLVKQHKSIAAASRATKGATQGNIHSVCNLTRKTCCGFVWRYTIDAKSKKAIPWKPDRKLDVLELINQTPKQAKSNKPSKEWTDKKLRQIEKKMEEDRFRGSFGSPDYVRAQHFSSSLHWARKKAIIKQESSD